MLKLFILEIFLAKEYNIALLYAALSIGYGLWIATLGLLAKAFFSWYRLSNKNVMVLIFALSRSYEGLSSSRGLSMGTWAIAIVTEIIPL